MLQYSLGFPKDTRGPLSSFERTFGLGSSWTLGFRRKEGWSHLDLHLTQLSQLQEALQAACPRGLPNPYPPVRPSLPASPCRCQVSFIIDSPSQILHPDGAGVETRIPPLLVRPHETLFLSLPLRACRVKSLH